MYSILPFETDFYKKHNYPVIYVGNPSVEEIGSLISRLPAKKHLLERLGITDPRPVIALLPGSRRGEIRNNLPLMIEAAKRFPDFQYIVAGAPSIPLGFYRETAQDKGLNVAMGYTQALLKHAVAATVTSGTATLETTLLGTPQVVCYRANGKALSYKIMERLLKVKYVSLPNLIADAPVVPELLVHKCTADSIARSLSPLLQPSPIRDRQLAGYKLIHKRLGTSIATDTAACHICRSLGIETPQSTKS